MYDDVIERLVMTHLNSFSMLDVKRVARPNINFTAPATGIWMRVNIQTSTSQITSITTNPCTTDYGYVTFQVFDRENTGTGNIKKFASALSKHFNCKQLGQLDLEAAYVITVGSDGNGFYQLNVQIPFKFYSQQSQ